MENYIDVVKDLVKSMEDTAYLLSKFKDMRDSCSEREFYDTISKLNKDELEELQCKYDRFSKIIKSNL